MNHPFRRQRVAMEPALALQPTVLRDGGQYAIFVALLRQPCWCGDGCTRAAAGGIWEAILGTQTEGKIKGRGTSARRKPCLHVGWRGTRFMRCCAVCGAKAAPALVYQRASPAGLGSATPELMP